MIIAIETHRDLTAPDFTAEDLITDLFEQAQDFDADAEEHDTFGFPEQAARSRYFASVCRAVAQRIRDAVNRNDYIEDEGRTLKVSIEFFGDISAMEYVLIKAVNRHFLLKRISFE